jgi:hypothetical protein
MRLRSPSSSRDVEEKQTQGPDIQDVVISTKKVYRTLQDKQESVGINLGKENQEVSVLGCKA